MALCLHKFPKIFCGPVTTVRPGFGLYVSCFVCTSRSTSSAEVGFSESSWRPLEDPLPSAGKVGRVWLLGGYETDKTSKIRKSRQRYARRYAQRIAGSYLSISLGPHGQGLQLSCRKHLMNHRGYEDMPKDVFFTSLRILKIRGQLGT